MQRLLVLCTLFCLAGTSRAQKVLVLRGGTLVDVSSGNEMRDSIIVIRGARIEEIGAEGSIAIPQNAQIVEARGKWIVPGLIDSHAHFYFAQPDILILQ